MKRGNSSSELKNSVKVTGALELPKLEKLNFSESELVGIYNKAPKALLRKIIKISVTEESLIKKNEKPIVLENAQNGNYWVIPTEDSNYWLFPKSNLKINTYRYETVKSLFKCQGYQPEEADKFTLTKPARVSLSPSGKQWQLEEQGVLEFGSTSPASELQLELEQANEEIEQLQDQLEQSHRQIEQLQDQLAIANQAIQELEQFQFQKERAKMSLVKKMWVRSQSQLERFMKERL